MKSMSIRSLTAAAVCSTLFSTFLPAIAGADTYHSVEAGDTLGSIARQYNVSVESLRQANKLNLGENSQLAAMLLRIPGASDQQEIKLPSQSAPSRSSASSISRFYGSVTRYETYTVQTGDTCESIAARYNNGGQTVSAGDIRSQNKLEGQPQVGVQLTVPVRTTYGGPTRTASAQMTPSVARAITPVTRNTPTASGSDKADVAVSVSEEMDLPFAKGTPSTGGPVYTAPNKSNVKTYSNEYPSVTEQPTRGNLPSRGGYGAPTVNRRNVDGAQILQAGEELVTTPTPRNTDTADDSRDAKVAKVVHGGARIRRLPDSDAVTLYRCGTGTELAVLKQKGPWSAILMSDRSTGWMPTHYLQFTGNSVDVSTQVITDNSSDAANNWRSGYNSNHPAIRYALSWLGTPYLYGGEGRSGIDCSSLMQKSFASCGVRLPRVSRDQAKVGKPVAPENLQPGDRLYFSASGTHIDHTGLYMGNGLFVHASGRAHKVTVSRLTEPRSWNIFVCARR